MLFFQAVAFYAPRFLWKAWEGGRMKALANDLNGPLLNEATKAGRIQVRSLLVNISSTHTHTRTRTLSHAHKHTYPLYH